MVNYKAIFEIEGAVSHGIGLKESDNYKEEKEFELDEKYPVEQIICKAIFLGNEIAKDALSNPKTDLTKVTLLELYGPEGEISQEGFVSKYSEIYDKNGNSISFEKNGLNQIVLEDHHVEKLLRFLD